VRKIMPMGMHGTRNRSRAGFSLVELLVGMVVGEMGAVGKSYLMKLGAAFFLTAGLGLMEAKMGFHFPEDPRVIA